MTDTVSEAPAASPQLDQARSAFIQEAQKLPGVSVQICNGRSAVDSTIRVLVSDILGHEVDEVYAIEIRIRRRFHGASLNIEIEEAVAGESQSHDRE